VLQVLTERKSSHINIHKQFMAQPQDEALARLFKRKRQPTMLGSKEFISWVKDRFSKRK